MSQRSELDTGRFLAAGAAVAAVAGAASYVVYLLAGVFSSDPVLVPAQPGGTKLVDLTGSDVFRSAFVAGIVATALLWVLILLVPTPTRFFGWLAGLFTVAVAVIPFSFSDELTVANQFWLAAINVVGALTILSLLLGVVPKVMRPASQPPASTVV